MQSTILDQRLSAARPPVGRKMKKLLSAALAFAALVASAGQTTDAQAETAVGNWMRLDPALGARIGAEPVGSRTVSADGGAPFHVVRMKGGGFVVASGDTEDYPFVAFSPADDLVQSEGNPLWCLLRRHFEIAAARKAASAAAAGRSKAGSPRPDRWARWLDGSAAAGRAKSGAKKLSISDPCVDPLLKSAWSQGSVTTASGATVNCYNRYTPNNYVCGCVATSMAQLMRYHRWPSEAVPQSSHYISCDGSRRKVTMEGGVYDWDGMPLVPAGSALTESQLDQIGRICRDAGYSVGMMYSASGSGAAHITAAMAMRDVWGYTNATAIGFGGTDAYQSGIPYSRENLKVLLAPMLAAGLPAIIGIPGHSVVCDGYGYSDDELWIHINMGWGDAARSNAWYLPDAIEYTDGTLFDGPVDDVIVNTSPSACRSLFCGRVYDGLGAPVAGAAVTADDSAGHVFSTVANSHGVYAFAVPPGTYLVSAEIGGSVVTGRVTTRASVGSLTGGAVIGNVCDVDLCAPPSDEDFLWTGGGDGVNFSDAANWSGGASPTNGATIVFAVSATMDDTTLVNDIPEFAPESVIFAKGCAEFSIAGCAFSGPGRFMNNSSSEIAILAPVAFDGPVASYGKVRYTGGVTGTDVLSGDTVIYGAYTLSGGPSGEWTPPRGLTVSSGSSVTVDTYVNSSSGTLVVETGGAVTCRVARITGDTGYLAGSIFGTFTATDELRAESAVCDMFVDSDLQGRRMGTVFARKFTGVTPGTPKLMNTRLEYVVGDGGFSGSFWCGESYPELKIHGTCDYVLSGVFRPLDDETFYMIIDTDAYSSDGSIRVVLSPEGSICGKASLHICGSGAFDVRGTLDLTGTSYRGDLWLEDASVTDVSSAAGFSVESRVYVGYGATLVVPRPLPDGEPVIRCGELVSTYSSLGDKGLIVLGDGSPLEEGFYKIAATGRSSYGSYQKQLEVVNGTVGGAAKTVDYAGTLLYCAVGDVETPGWIEENKAMQGYTGSWSEPVVYGADGTAAVPPGAVFSACEPSSKDLVTIDSQISFGAPRATPAVPKGVRCGIRLGTNGLLQAAARIDGVPKWIDVTAPGFTPSADAMCIIRVEMNFRSCEYTVAVLDGEVAVPLVSADDGAVAFAIPYPPDGEGGEVNVRAVEFRGGGRLRGIRGVHEMLQFMSGDIVGANRDIRLRFYHADWLNDNFDYREAKAALEGMSASDFEEAYKFNLDITKEHSAKFDVGDISVDGEEVIVTLVTRRTGALPGEMNIYPTVLRSDTPDGDFEWADSEQLAVIGADEEVTVHVFSVPRDVKSAFLRAYAL